ncbi:MAG: hypothetical protein WC565_10525 [Parcubacteria group bacterium]
MWIPIIVAGGTALGLWLLMRDDEGKGKPSGIKIPEPEGATNTVSASFRPYYVLVDCFDATSDESRNSYMDMRRFSTWDEAYRYYKTLEDFFGQSHGYWTCSGGYCQISLFGSGEQKATKRWEICDEATLR